MNELNYASFEACKRLVDAGIVLETEAHWIRVANSPMMLVENRYGADEHYPAPSMAEVWRELPWYVLRDDVNCQLQIEKYNTFTAAYYDGTGPNYTSENPTDALIDLLVWLKGEVK